MTTAGFISAVAHRDDNELLMVRARVKSHLNQLTEDLSTIYQVEGGDYPWRLVISKEKFNRLLTQQIDEMKYDNFKNAANKNEEYGNFLSSVWTLGYSYGQRRNPDFKGMYSNHRIKESNPCQCSFVMYTSEPNCLGCGTRNKYYVG